MTGTDPYLPGHGDAGFGVDHYDLDLAYKPAGNRLEAEAVLTCTAADDLDALQLDLDGLKVTRLLVDGARPAKFGQSSGRLRVKLAETIEAGEGFEIRVKYAGSPTPVRSRKLGTAGWEELEDGVIVAAQPHGAPSWFPCNDRPDDKATYRLRISCPAEYYVAVSGELDSAQRSGASTVWTYRMERPMATYLATVQIGQYALREQDAEVPMRVVAPREVRGEGYDLSFGRQPEMMAFFTDAFGPYPFPGYTTVITADELEIPLESQSLSTFGSNFASGEWDCVRLVAHEMAHQWFGNAVTLRHWRDIWLHEGFACYAEWLWSEESGAGTADERAAHHHGRLVELPQDLLLSDPGPADMFDDRVYKRGALTLHALRARVGDDAFFGTLQTWVRDFDGASVTTEEFVAHAEEVCGSELGDLFEEWLYRTELPDLPVLSGDFEPEETS